MFKDNCLIGFFELSKLTVKKHILLDISIMNLSETLGPFGLTLVASFHSFRVLMKSS